MRPDHAEDSQHAGSYSFDDGDRPRWDQTTVREQEYPYHHEDSTYAYSLFKGRRADGQKVFVRGRSAQGSNDLQMAQMAGELYRLPGLENVRKGTGDEPDLLYRLPELIAAMAERPDELVFITEGEKDADRLWSLGLIATTNPNGALNWNDDFNARFTGRDVVILVDNDDRGRERAQ